MLRDILLKALDSMTEFGFDKDINSGVYRTPSGKGCIIGHIISDEQYLPEFENYPVCHGSEIGNRLRGAIMASNPGLRLTDSDLVLLSKLQTNHDSFAVRGRSIKAFKTTARKMLNEYT